MESSSYDFRIEEGHNYFINPIKVLSASETYYGYKGLPIIANTIKERFNNEEVKIKKFLTDPVKIEIYREIPYKFQAFFFDMFVEKSAKEIIDHLNLLLEFLPEEIEEEEYKQPETDLQENDKDWQLDQYWEWKYDPNPRSEYYASAVEQYFYKIDACINEMEIYRNQCFDYSHLKGDVESEKPVPPDLILQVIWAKNGGVLDSDGYFKLDSAEDFFDSDEPYDNIFSTEESAGDY